MPHISCRIIPGFPDKDDGHKEFLFSLPRFADDAVSYNIIAEYDILDM